VSKKNVLFANSDWLATTLVFVLIIMGWLNIYAAVYNEDHSSIFDFSERYGKQLIWIIAALVIWIAVFAIDEKFWQFFGYLIYGVTIILLMAVLIIGTEVNGQKAWFAIGGFRIQPAEFAKVGISLALAKYMSYFNFKLLKLKSILIIGLILLIPFALILAQPDTGSALVYCVFFFVLFREGLPLAILLIGFIVAILFFMSLLLQKATIIIILISLSFIVYLLLTRKYKNFILGILIMLLSFGLFYLANELAQTGFGVYLLLLGSLAVAGIFFAVIAIRKKIQHVMLILSFLVGSIIFTFTVDFVFHNVLEKHQQTRINILLGFEQDPLGKGYNVNQSKIAIGSGGFWGKGFMQGTQTKFNFVPEQSTDFIFCTIGEEWGFAGSTLVILLLTLLLFRLLIIAERQRNSFDRIFGYSVVSIFFFHILINIGMAIGLLPVIGIPLPFFSYGGSSLWSFTLLVSILLKLDSSRWRYMK
jgi:rod shape determining protein RodA